MYSQVKMYYLQIYLNYNILNKFNDFNQLKFCSIHINFIIYCLEVLISLSFKFPKILKTIKFIFSRCHITLLTSHILMEQAATMIPLIQDTMITHTAEVHESIFFYIRNRIQGEAGLRGSQSSSVTRTMFLKQEQSTDLWKEDMSIILRVSFKFLTKIKVQHQRDYVPVPRLEKRTEYVPVDRYNERIDYYPVERS